MYLCIQVSLLFICLSLFGCRTLHSSDSPFHGKEVCPELGVWISDNDVALNVFFSDQTFLIIYAEKAHYGTWDYCGSNTLTCTLENGRSIYTLETNDGEEELVLHQDDYSESFGKRLLVAQSQTIDIRFDSITNSYPDRVLFGNTPETNTSDVND